MDGDGRNKCCIAKNKGKLNLVEEKKKVEHLQKNSAEVLTLGDKKISEKIILPGRFKRVYVEEGHGKIFIGGKQIYELDPSNKKFLSTSKHENLDEISIKQNTIF